MLPATKPLGQYLVSADGIITSLKWREPRVLRQTVGKKGYCKVSVDGKNQYVHRLIWEAWVGPVPEGKQVRHYDGNPQHNWLDNLRLGDQKQNEADKTRHGTRPLGEGHANSLLTAEAVTWARQMYRQGYRLPEIERRLGVDVERSTLHLAITGGTWAHLPEPPIAVGGERGQIERLTTCECGRTTATPRRGKCQACYRREMRQRKRQP